MGSGYFAMSRAPLTKTVETGLPAGEYCNIIDECATTVTVDAASMATISIDGPDKMVALCVGCTGDPVDPGVTGEPADTTTQQPLVTTTQGSLGWDIGFRHLLNDIFQLPCFCRKYDD